MGFIGAALKLGMVLDTNKKRMVWQFHGFYQTVVRGGTAYCKAVLLENFPVSIVNFKPVPMPFADLLLAVQLLEQGIFPYLAGVSA